MPVFFNQPLHWREGLKRERQKGRGQKDWGKNYPISDMKVLFRRGDWNDWDNAIHGLESKGEQDNELPPGEVVAMKDDLRKLKEKGVQLSKNPQELCGHAEHCRSGG